MTAKIEALEKEHSDLEDEIKKLQCWPGLAPEVLKRLKLKKLKVKDEITRLSRQPEPATSP